jgi:hypothetical protein
VTRCWSCTTCNLSKSREATMASQGSKNWTWQLWSKERLAWYFPSLSICLLCCHISATTCIQQRCPTGLFHSYHNIMQLSTPRPTWELHAILLKVNLYCKFKLHKGQAISYEFLEIYGTHTAAMRRVIRPCFAQRWHGSERQCKINERLLIRLWHCGASLVGLIFGIVLSSCHSKVWA